MSRISEPLVAQHRQLDVLSAALGEAAQRSDWGAFRMRLAALGEALARHFDFEEEELFPACEAAHMLAPDAIAELRVEHGELRRRLATLAAAAPALDPEGCREELRAFLALLAPHLAKEESRIYPASERLPSARIDALARPVHPASPSGIAEVDVRDLEPPEPMLRILGALDRARGMPLRALIHREPFPLYEILHEQGYRWSTRVLEDGSYEILIESAPRR